MSADEPSATARPPHRGLSGWVYRLGHPNFVQGGIVRILALATVIVTLCGLGYYVVDPAIGSFGEGVWLAFTTAATVGYGDIVPSTDASRVFSVIVVVVGFAVLSLVTASISALLVGRQERKLEADILRDLHKQVALLRQEIADLKRHPHAPPAPPPSPRGGDEPGR